MMTAKTSKVEIKFITQSSGVVADELLRLEAAKAKASLVDDFD